MPTIHPFDAVQYRNGEGNVSGLVAPPYDVLDASAKQALLDKDARNVVAIDLPHCPPKELGPAEAYEGAAARFKAWLSDGTLSQRGTPALYAYRQTFEFMDRRFERCGMTCTVDVVPFGPRAGGGILPHEETFSGPKEDRFALMRATGMQLSPIFGLHADESGRATSLIRDVMAARPAHMTADLGDGVVHEIWTVDDQARIGAYRDALADEDIFIADGHHRYNTALRYLDSLGAVPDDHPARRCMMVLVGMSDPGLAIGPTHRVLGGMADYSIQAFLDAASGHLVCEEGPQDPHALGETLLGVPIDENAFGLLDLATNRCCLARLATPDPLAASFGSKPLAWRTLDVALIQYLIVENICQPKLNGGEAVRWAFPHSIDEVLEIGSGAETGAGGGAGFAQLAVLVRPTPLSAVRDISRANELMPQKSTYFYPKLATGFCLNPLQ